MVELFENSGDPDQTCIPGIDFINSFLISVRFEEVSSTAQQ